MVVRYWVVGGEYEDTKFQAIARGRKEEMDGPFSSYEEAHKAWAQRAWSTVDDCHARYRIVRQAEDESGFAGGTD